MTLDDFQDLIEDAWCRYALAHGAQGEKAYFHAAAVALQALAPDAQVPEVWTRCAAQGDPIVPVARPSGTALH